LNTLALAKFLQLGPHQLEILHGDTAYKKPSIQTLDGTSNTLYCSAVPTISFGRSLAPKKQAVLPKATSKPRAPAPSTSFAMTNYPKVAKPPTSAMWWLIVHTRTNLVVFDGLLGATSSIIPAT
jgi:hypothetical protein